MVSTAALTVESTLAFAESATAEIVSVAALTVESTLFSVLELLQAAKEPIANTNKSFFIVMSLFVNDFLLIPVLKKSNLPDSRFWKYFF